MCGSSPQVCLLLSSADLSSVCRVSPSTCETETFFTAIQPAVLSCGGVDGVFGLSAELMFPPDEQAEPPPELQNQQGPRLHCIVFTQHNTIHPTEQKQKEAERPCSCPHVPVYPGYFPEHQSTQTPYTSSGRTARPEKSVSETERFSIQFQLVVFRMTATELARPACRPGSEADRKPAGGRVDGLQGVDLDSGDVSKQTVSHSLILLVIQIRMCFLHSLVKMCSGSLRHRILFFA